MTLSSSAGLLVLMCKSISQAPFNKNLPAWSNYITYAMILHGNARLSQKGVKIIRLESAGAAMTLSELIVKYRTEHGLSQRQFSAICGLSNGYISMLEREINPSTGQPVTPTIQKLQQLADGMKIDIADLMAEADDIPVFSDEENPRNSENVCPITIGQRIKLRREELGLSQEELARRSGYGSKSSINKIEMNQRNLSQSKIKAIADALDTTPSSIMGWNENGELDSFIKPSSAAERIQQVMDEQGLKQVDVLDLAKPYCKKYGFTLGKTALSQYITGKFEPRKGRLKVLALALNVSEAWLLGYDVPKEREAAPIDERGEECIRLFNKLSIEQQDIVINALKGILAGSGLLTE